MKCMKKLSFILLLLLFPLSWGFSQIVPIPLEKLKGWRAELTALNLSLNQSVANGKTLEANVNSLRLQSQDLSIKLNNLTADYQSLIQSGQTLKLDLMTYKEKSEQIELRYNELNKELLELIKSYKAILKADRLKNKIIVAETIAIIGLGAVLYLKLK